MGWVKRQETLIWTHGVVEEVLVSILAGYDWTDEE
jgi:hypothetical protein